MTKEEIIEILQRNLQLDMPNPDEAESLVADEILALDKIQLHKEGWECPRCGKIHSYLDMACDCPPKYETSTT